MVINKGEKMDFNTFEQKFVPFCETPRVQSGKARSFFLAIKYLAEYLNLPDLGHGNAYKILDKEDEIKDKTSEFYHNLDKWLEQHHRKSYLKKGFIRAAMSYFGRFAADNNLL